MDDPMGVDKSLRDVTARYFGNFLMEIGKVRCPSRKGSNWFAELLRPYRRPYELVRSSSPSSFFFFFFSGSWS